MKKLLIPLCLTAFFLASWNCVQAQKIYKAALQYGEYADRLTSNESPLKQAVHNAFAQQKEVTVLDFTNAITQEASAFKLTLQKYLKSENIFSITDASAFTNLIRERPSAITLMLPYKNKNLVVDLVASDIFGDNFKIYTDKNSEGISLENSAFYKGVVRGSNSAASISLFADHVEGYITLNQKTSVEITRISGTNPTNQHAVYNDEDLLSKGIAHNCTLLNPPASQLEKTPNKTGTDKEAAVKLKCVTNFWETAYSVYQSFGTVKKVTDFATALFNVYATIYSNESIGMKLNSGFVWTSQDPYHDDLSTFSSLRTGFNANTAVLLSNAATGGVAWLNTICQSGDTYRHAYCGSINLYEDILPVTSYSWPVMVASHEVGHNLGSPHTHACAWNGNNTAIDGCGPAAGYSEGCNGPIPAEGGTIMSYCHLLSVGINLTLGFGPQPGDLIRTNVNSCITATCNAVGGNCLPPANLGTAAITATSATVGWKKVIGAAYYYIYLSADNGATYTLVADHLYSTTYKLTGLVANHAYLCDVWVSCGNGNYSKSSTSFTTSASFAADVTAQDKVAFTIQPNPVRGGQFTVALQKGYEKALVEVINSSNQVMYQSRTGSSVRTFSAPRIGGLYYVRITLDGEVITRKFLAE